MDVEDEPNSYLKLLSDSEPSNAFLLGNNEVGLFSVEPIFTEMEATDWPQEEFPLLLTNSLITEESTTQNTSPPITEDLSDSIHLQESLSGCMNQEHIEVKQEDTKLQGTSVVGAQNNRTDHSDSDLEQLKSHQFIISKNEITFDQTDRQFKNENEISIEDSVQFSKNPKSALEKCDNAEHDELAEQEPNQNYILVRNAKPPKKLRTIELVNSDRTPILTSINLPPVQKNLVMNNKPKTVNDLFSTVIANKCKICSFLCEDLEQIKKHINSKHPEFIFTHNGLSNGVSILLSNSDNKVLQNSRANKEFTIYVCSECHAVCTDKNDLKKHMIQVHALATESENKSNETKQSESKPDKKVFAYLDDLNISLVKKQEKELQQVKCTVKGCAATFPTQSYRDKHEKLHIGDTKSMFKCIECDKIFMMWIVAKSHMHKDHGVDFGMIVCPMCNIFKSYKAVRMLKHMMIHSQVDPFLCSHCGKSFKQLSQLKNHEVVHKLPEDVPAWFKVKKCDKCEMFFANSKCLKMHIKEIHENIKPFTCNICGHKSSRKAMLELHTRQHTASKPHKCKYCEFRTADPNTLRKHMMKHLGEVTYQCPYCPYSCIQAGSIKSHFIRRHKNKAGVYFCRYCSYSTINETFLKGHEASHEKSINSKDTNVTERVATNVANLQAVTYQKSCCPNSCQHAGLINSHFMSKHIDMSCQLFVQTDKETRDCLLNAEPQIEETVGSLYQPTLKCL